MNGQCTVQKVKEISSTVNSSRAARGLSERKSGGAKLQQIDTPDQPSRADTSAGSAAVPRQPRQSMSADQKQGALGQHEQSETLTAAERSSLPYQSVAPDHSSPAGSPAGVQTAVGEPTQKKLGEHEQIALGQHEIGAERTRLSAGASLSDRSAAIAPHASVQAEQHVQGVKDEVLQSPPPASAQSSAGKHAGISRPPASDKQVWAMQMVERRAECSCRGPLSMCTAICHMSP